MADNHLQPWGIYHGLPVRAEFEDDGRNMRLLAELRYTGPNALEWIAPKSSETDGATIPRVFWSIIGGPFEGKYRAAAVLHDVACKVQNRPWQDVARMFYTAMRCSGVGEVTAKTMYYAVYNFGPHWRLVTGIRPSAVEANTKAVTGFMPPQPSEAEVARIQQWVAAENPSLEQIETQAVAPAPLPVPPPTSSSSAKTSSTDDLPQH